MAIQSLSSGTLEAISKILGDTGRGLTGSEISNFLFECDITDPGVNTTKWKRVYDSLALKQSKDRCGNNVVAFIQHVMRPSRHYNNSEWFEETQRQLNTALSFEGLELGDDGVVKAISKATTISEARARASKLKASLELRKVHPDIYKFCKEELLTDNYFHAVFEATKSVAEKIRNRTGLNSDGATLVDEAFVFSNRVPYLALNTLQTENEQSEQKGFMNLLKGVFGTFRNTTAHAPKIVWKMDEQDALDILSMMSLIHRRLDGAVEARLGRFMQDNPNKQSQGDHSTLSCLLLLQKPRQQTLALEHGR